jgi:PPM family protein phosphatase
MEKVEVCYRSDKGRRSTNEDSVLVQKVGENYLLAVADGLGGHNAGEVASKMTMIELDEYFKANQTEIVSRELMENAIAKANKEIYLLSQESPEYRGMGSTLVTAFYFGDKAIIANVGDSRAYLIKDGIKQLTTDHSLVQEMVENGIVSHEEAWHHSQKNIVTRVLGTSSEVKADFFEVQLDGGILLLCSDGLVDAIKDEQIRDIVITAPNIEIACNQLISKANEVGGRDNISVILARGKGS